MRKTFKDEQRSHLQWQYAELSTSDVQDTPLQPSRNRVSSQLK